MQCGFIPRAQVLSGDAYAPLEKFVPSIQKSVTSCVNAGAMTQFTWHDGSTKNIHVNLPAGESKSERACDSACESACESACKSACEKARER